MFRSDENSCGPEESLPGKRSQDILQHPVQAVDGDKPGTRGDPGGVPSAGDGETVRPESHSKKTERIRGNMKAQLICPYCRSSRMIKRGKSYFKDGVRQRYECMKCRKTTTKPRKGEVI